MKKVLVLLGILIVIIAAFGVIKYRNQNTIPVDSNEEVAVQNKNVPSQNETKNEISNSSVQNVVSTNTKNVFVNNTITDKKENSTQKNNIKETKTTETKQNTSNKAETEKNTSSETKKDNKDSSKKTIVIDPGHQTKGDSAKEPIGPGAKETKAKVTTGATGTFTKQKESELVLKVALQLEKALKQEGYNVIMTRRTNNVNISNIERAKIANNVNADAFIRIHADSYKDSSVNRNFNLMPNGK